METSEGGRGWFARASIWFSRNSWRCRIGLLLSVPWATAPACGGRSQALLAQQADMDGGTNDGPGGSAQDKEGGSLTDVGGPSPEVDQGDAPEDEDAHLEAAIEAGQRPAGDDGASEAAADAGAADDGGDALAFGCSSYCAAILAACRGENAQYKDYASCMNACQYLSPSAPGSTGAALACRAAQAAYAMTTPNPHCWNAGPLGYGACGQPYEGFCQIAAGLQQGQAGGLCSPSGGYDAGAPLYSSNADCLLRAAGYALVNMPTNLVQPPGRVGLDGGFSANGPAAGNTLDCRAYHLLIALQGGALQKVECANVGQDSPTCR